MTEQLIARERQLENFTKLAEEHAIMSEEKAELEIKWKTLEDEDAELKANLNAREQQLQNLQGQLASGAAAEEEAESLRAQLTDMKEKVASTEEQMIETIQAKDSQLSAMKESKFMVFTILRNNNNNTTNRTMTQIRDPRTDRSPLAGLFILILRFGSFRANETSNG